MTAGPVQPQLTSKRRIVTEFNHIHIHESGEWVCGRTMAFDDQELIRCEVRDPDEQEACHLCAQQLLAYFGEPMHVQ